MPHEQVVSTPAYETEEDVTALRRADPSRGSAILDAARGTGRAAVPVPQRKKTCGYKSKNGKCKTKLEDADSGIMYCEHHKCPVAHCFGFKGSKEVACAACCRGEQAHLHIEHAPPPPTRRAAVDADIDAVDPQGYNNPPPPPARLSRPPSVDERIALAAAAANEIPPAAPPRASLLVEGATRTTPRQLGSVTKYDDSVSDSDDDDDGYMRPGQEADAPPPPQARRTRKTRGDLDGNGDDGAAAVVSDADGGDSGEDSDSYLKPVAPTAASTAAAAAVDGAGATGMSNDRTDYISEDEASGSGDDYEKYDPSSNPSEVAVAGAGADGDIDPPEEDSVDPLPAKKETSNMYDAGGGRRSMKVKRPAKEETPFPEGARLVTCTYDFAPEHKKTKPPINQLPMKKGEKLRVVEDADPGWWTCENVGGKKGIVPANYLKEESDYEEYDGDDVVVGVDAADEAFAAADSLEAYLAPEAEATAAAAGSVEDGAVPSESASRVLTLDTDQGDGADDTVAVKFDGGGAGEEPSDGYEDMDALDGDAVILSGWFKKRGEGKLARAQVRWFEMSTNEIRFYVKKDDPATFKNCIPLMPQTKAAMKKKDGGDGHQLRIEQPERCWRLMPFADKQTEKKGSEARKQVTKWKEKINGIIKRKYGMAKHTTGDSEA